MGRLPLSEAELKSSYCCVSILLQLSKLQGLNYFEEKMNNTLLSGDNLNDQSLNLLLNYFIYNFSVYYSSNIYRTQV